MNIGDRIKQRRLELGIDADELAMKIGKSRATVYRYENGDIENMPTTVLEPIAKALNTTPAYLMGWCDIEKWNKESQQLEDTINAFYYQLRGLGWSYKWLDDEKLYILSNSSTSIKISADEYGTIVEGLQNFLRKALQKLILKSSALDLNAAHTRTDIFESDKTDDLRQQEEDIMDDPNF